MLFNVTKGYMHMNHHKVTRNREMKNPLIEHLRALFLNR